MENQTVTSESPAAPASLSQKSSFKTFLVGLSLVLFGVLLGVLIDRFLLSVSLQPGSEINPTPTASISATPTAVITPATLATENWQTFTNTKNNYSFKYPPEYFKYIEEVASDNSVYLATSEGKGETAGSPMGLSSDDVWLIVRVGVAKSGQLSTSKETIVLNGPQPTVSFQTIIVDKGKAFRVVMSSFSKDTLAQQETTFDNIISTFQFVNSQTSYTCPATEWVDCMPSTDSRPRPQCSREFLDWARANCPGFQGAAL